MTFGRGDTHTIIGEAEARAILAEGLAAAAPDARRVLVIIPDATRTAPIPLFFRLLTELLLPQTEALDFLVALGTHPLMSAAALRRLVGITAAEARGQYGTVELFNHRWDQPEQLITLDTLEASEVRAITQGRLDMAVPVSINRLVLRYDTLLICGPTYPHEVAGFSGGNKYFFPGISGPDVIHITHWLGALLTSRALIGTPDTAVRALIDRAAACIPRRKLCASLVVDGEALRGLYVGAPEAAWQAAADLSSRIHIHWVDRPYRRALAVIPPMYADLWTGAKGMYKLEPVIEDGGEIVLYAPHIGNISYTHGRILNQIGYHGSEYFVQQWSRFRRYPWAVLAHSAHVRGEATFEGNVETPRINVTLASRVPRVVCERLGLGYLDPSDVNLNAWQGQDDTLFVPKAGERLYRLLPPQAAAR